MKKIKTLTAIVLAMILAPMTSFAHDFEILLKDGNKLYFNITDSEKKTVEVTYPGSIADEKKALPTGKLDIPEYIRHGGKTYAVKSIGRKAFSGAVKLEEVKIPMTVETIDSFAFEGCISLSSIIYSAVQPFIGEGAFFNCTNIMNIVFGNRWETINFAFYAWSESLLTVDIPASVTRITNLKSLRFLEKINVMAGNKQFSSADGLLMSKDGSSLFACPRGLKSSVGIPDGTEKVLDGAFAGCYQIESIVFPETLKEMPYDEFLKLDNLNSVTFLSSEPVKTSLYKGEKIFSLQKASGKLTLYVPKEAYSRYTSQNISETGFYTSLDGKKGDKCYAESFINKLNIKKIK